MAILATQRVLTHNYWKLAEDIVPGDYLFDRMGQPVKVTIVQKYKAPYCYEVLFNDYLTISGDKLLSLPLEDKRYRYRSDGHKGRHQFRRPLKEKTVEELVASPLVDHRNRKKYSVPTSYPIQLPHQTLPVPPFVFGFWFFARQHDKTMAPAKGCGEFVHQKFKDCGYKVTQHRLKPNKERTFTTKPTVLSHLIPDIPTKIPENYLLADEEQRFELLQGILCSTVARYHEKTKKIRVYQRNKTLIYQIQYLADSIGCQTTLSQNDNTLCYTLYIKTKQRLLPTKQQPSKAKHAARRFVTNITPISPQWCVHIETDGLDNTILVGEGFISCR